MLAIVCLMALAQTPLRAAVSTLVPVDAFWRYLDNGSNQDTNWVALGFGDGAWAVGQAELGYGDGDEATTVSFGGNPNNRHVTTYFRHRFVLTNNMIYSDPTLKLVRDDGAIVYLNGHEVFRDNLPPVVNSSTLALADIDGIDEFTFVTTNISGSLLVGGANILAVEIHQASRSSPDISFALELTAMTQSNRPPSVLLTAPTNGTTFFAPAQVVFAAIPSDPDGPVSRVEFFSGTNRLGESTSAPFDFTWSGVGPGSYPLRAVAVDPMGLRGTSGIVNITVLANLLPSVTVLAPSNNSVFIAPADIGFLATAQDPDGSINRVEFHDGDTLLGEDASPPYTFTWENVGVGNYQFNVVSVDNAGGRSNPEVIDIVVRENTPPLVSLTSPTNSARFVALADITLRATASDNETRVEQVRFFEGTTLLRVLTNAPYTFVWSNVAVGTYSLSAVAVDDYGLARTSAVASVSVVPNVPPTITLQFPTNGASFVAPADILLRAAASDTDGFMRVVEFYQGTNYLGESRDSPFFLSWMNVHPGVYNVSAVAIDNKGGASTSAVATITVRLPTVVRGPYLQNGNTNSITIRWRTDAPTDSRVRYGAAPQSLSETIYNSTRVTDHEIRLTGLAPDTRYYYSVGFDGVNLIAGEDCFFVTSPSRPRPTRIWVLGDSGTSGADARAVRDAYYALTGTNHTDLWLMLGDNAYWTGFDIEYQYAVFDMYPEMLRKSVLWPALGNHDAYALDVSGTFPYLDIFTLPTNAEAGGVPSGTEKYYSFDYGNVHFVCLDSMTVDRSSNGVMLAWLEQDLAANTNDWLIAYWHHPPYSKGSHDSDWEFELIEMRENALPILERYGVDLVLAGHSHSYERSMLVGGHYGASDTLVPEMIRDGGDGRWDGAGAYVKRLNEIQDVQSAVYIVAGSSGQVSGGELNHPVMLLSLNELGSLVLDVDGRRMDVKFLQDTGIIGDEFTILKGVFTNSLSVVSMQTAEGSVQLTWRSNPGESYVIEAADSFLATSWRPVGLPVRANTTLTTASVAVAVPVTGQTFYRIRLAPRSEAGPR